MIDIKTANVLVNDYNKKISQLTEELMTKRLSDNEINVINTTLRGYISAKSHIMYKLDNNNTILNEDELLTITNK